jgi:electron transfer flavoprotein alpha subunit
VPLAEADFIVAAGNGVQDWAAFHSLSAALGASEAGSRVVCDAGQLPRSKQVGASGTAVSARCYVSFGVSGASQHLQGITQCEHVIAVNTDAQAEIFKRANLGIIGDAQRIMRALEAVARRKSGKP